MLYCHKCDSVVKFERYVPHGALSCSVCSKVGKYCMIWDSEWGYYVINFRCEAYGNSSIGVFKNETLHCIKCKNSQCDNGAYFELLTQRLFAAMKCQFDYDESFNPDIWTHTFPRSLEIMYKQRKEIIHERLAELKCLPNTLKDIVESYVLTCYQ